MRTLAIVFQTPFLDELPGMTHRHEPMLVQALIAAANTASLISLRSIAKMVGSTRQLIAWREEHFRALALLRDCWELHDESYVFLMTGSNENLKYLVSRFGFVPENAKQHG